MIKEFKDVLGNTIEVGQTVLYISNNDSGDEIIYILCEVIKICHNSIKVKYRKPNNTEDQSYIFRTSKKIVILQNQSYKMISCKKFISNRWGILDL